MGGGGGGGGGVVAARVGIIFFVLGNLHPSSHTELNDKGWMCDGLPINPLQDGVLDYCSHFKFHSPHTNILEHYCQDMLRWNELWPNKVEPRLAVLVSLVLRNG